MLKKFISLACVLALLFSLSACGQKEDPNKAFMGTWTLSAITNNGTDASEDVMDALNKSGLTYQLIMNSDLSGTLDLAGTQSNFTWAANEDDTTQALLDAEGNQLTVTLQEDGTLLMNEGDMALTFTKQESGTDSSDTTDDAAASDESQSQ